VFTTPSITLHNLESQSPEGYIRTSDYSRTESQSVAPITSYSLDLSTLALSDQTIAPSPLMSNRISGENSSLTSSFSRRQKPPLRYTEHNSYFSEPLSREEAERYPHHSRYYTTTITDPFLPSSTVSSSIPNVSLNVGLNAGNSVSSARRLTCEEYKSGLSTLIQIVYHQPQGFWTEKDFMSLNKYSNLLMEGMGQAVGSVGLTCRPF
jgi:hypothetical protein